MGLISIVIWSTVIAFSRSLVEELGTFTSGGSVYLAGGALSLGLLWLRHRGFSWTRGFATRYLLTCGGLFVLYEVMLYLAIGLSTTRQQTLEVGLINYLWISFTFAFSVPVLKKKAGWPLIAGMVMAVAGVAIATLPPGYSLAELQTNLQQHGAPYLLSLGCAVSWGLYSNLSRKWGSESGESAVPIFLLATGLTLLGLRLFAVEQSHWSTTSVAQLIYVALLPTTVAYIAWDIAMRRGNLILIASLSYIIPLASTIISSILLHVTMSANLWIACILVIAGAVVCRYSVRD